MGKGPRRMMNGYEFSVSGLFAGIGGIELGLSRSGHRAELLCEVDPACKAVLEQKFEIAVHDDVKTLDALPDSTQVLTAGFPCQDLSQAGATRGIAGTQSGLVGEVFRLLQKQRVPWVLLENVPFMLQLGRGRAMEVIVSALEELGYEWAYRVVDSRSFGLPQRRRRVYLIATLDADPRSVLFADEAGEPEEHRPHRDLACGFYWTEGIRGLGWAINSVPTLKGGSTVGIPSPPAIAVPSGEICKPDLRDAERLQGFDSDWTKAAETVGRPSMRWKLVGNAVSVPAAEWIGKRLSNPGVVRSFAVDELRVGDPWPTAAWSYDGRRLRVTASEWPRQDARLDLLEFLAYPMSLLSEKATAGFLSRTQRSHLRFPEGFLEQVQAHLIRMKQGRDANLTLFEPRASYDVAALIT